MSFKNNKISKNEEEWRKILSDEAFEVTRKKATEAPFSGEYNSNIRRLLNYYNFSNLDLRQFRYRPSMK